MLVKGFFMNLKKVLLITSIALSVILTITVALVYFLFSKSKPQPKTALSKFSSCEDFIDSFRNGKDLLYSGRGGELDSPFISMLAPGSKDMAEEAAPDYSETNVQVEGVDEADIVKNDGEYIYTVSENKIIICRAYPPSESKILSKINFEEDDNYNVDELFIDTNRLIAIGNTYSEENDDYLYLTSVKIWDTTDKSNPKIAREIEYEGTYSTSRKIEDYVYLVLNSYPDYVLYEKYDIEASDIVPKYRDTKGEKNIGDLQSVCQCTDIDYTNPDSFTNFLSILSIPTENVKDEIGKKIIAGSSENVYASQENLYVTNTAYDYKVYSSWSDYLESSDEKTDIYKFSLDRQNIDYQGEASVFGTVLNQFSMDEYDSYFRITTTKGEMWREDSSATNNVYILDSDLKESGKIENIAPGEEIYSARFMGSKGYLVTFKKIDPFFTLDLSDPKNPKILGKLKIPGYSDYLHLYDENHIIGIGKNAEEAEEGNFAWYQGIKMALFDVSDFENPKEMYKVEIGDRGTDSYVLRDHKAFLFDKEKNLLVIPVLLAEIPEEEKAESASNAYGDYKYQGAYVYDLSLKEGFKLKGRITHIEGVFDEESSYYYNNNSVIQRSLYIGDFLYTISEAKAKINNLDDLEEINEIKFD